MKLIKPSEISAKILTLLDESNERVIIVSPYLKISKWFKLTNKINALRTKGVILEIFVRDDPGNTESYKDLDQLALQYKKIPHLHSKLYLNEKYGIVTSMNLLLSSEFNSLEIGYATETMEEYHDLLKYFYRYIQARETLQAETFASQQDTNLEKIMENIKDEIDRIGNNSWTWLKGNELHVCTGKDNFRVSINEGTLSISARLIISSEARRKYIKHPSPIAKKVNDLTAMKVHVHAGPAPDILLLSGQIQHRLKSPCITRMMEIEARYVMESVLKFIEATDNLLLQ